MDKLFDIDDLTQKRDWLAALAGYTEWEYPLNYQLSIQDVITLLDAMIREEQ